MRASRMLSILMSLQVQHRITARELATRLEVSERTIHRDMDALSLAGIPVYAERGVDGGWSLLEEYRTTLNGLHLDEIQALFVGAPHHVLSDLGLKPASDAALLKLLAGLPAHSRQDAAFARQRIHIDAAGWHSRREETPTLCTLQEALWQERVVEIDYQRDDGIVVRLAHPLGLVVKGRVWYLVAMIEKERVEKERVEKKQVEEMRTYRVARVKSATITDQRAQRPTDFDLAAYWEQSLIDFKAGLPRYLVKLRVRAQAIPHLNGVRFSKVEAVEPADEQGWSVVSIRFEVEEEAVHAVLGFGSQVEVLEPAALRAQVIEQIRAVDALYQCCHSG